jgi:pyruvate dehydrogenase E1 component alpha subunit
MEQLSREEMLGLYETMLKIRQFELKAIEVFEAGELYGFLHSYCGEEAIAAGVCANLTDTDCILSTHRGHGHLIAKGADMNKMMAELYGKATGYCKGKSGSMHMADVGIGIMGANGIVGGSMPTAVGVGFALRYKNDHGRVAVTFFGDGASNRGTFHESLNMASVMNLPVVFVCENNNFGMSTPQSAHQKIKEISVRAKAYDIPGVTVDGNDVLAVYDAAAEAVQRARKDGGPTLLEYVTWRHYGHFIGDPAPYKDPEDQKKWLEKDPIPAFAKKLIDLKISDQAELDAIKAVVDEQVEVAVDFGRSSPYPGLDELYTDVYAD